MALHSDVVGVVSIEYLLKPLEFVHVGASSHVGEITSAGSLQLQLSDNPVIKQKNGKPYMPGSSLKGTLRSHVYRLLKAIQKHASSMSTSEEKISTSEEEPFALLSNIVSKHPIETPSDIAKKFQRARNREEKLSLLNNVGLMDKLFGYSGLASILRFEDAVSIEDYPHVIQRRHVKIDSGRDRAESGRLFDVEGVSVSQSFKGRISYMVSNDPHYRPIHWIFYHVIWLPLMSGEMEMLLGGQKSRGYGRVKVIPVRGIYESIESTVLNEPPVEMKTLQEAEQLKSYLLLMNDDEEK